MTIIISRIIIIRSPFVFVTIVVPYKHKINLKLLAQEVLLFCTRMF